MNYLTEDQFNTAMSSPPVAAELIKMLAEDMAICIAILAGPEANHDKHHKMIRAILQDVEAGAALAQARIVAHLEGKIMMFNPRIVIP